MRRCYVYILANRRNGVLYVGVTNNLVRRVFEHQEKLSDGFTKTYGVSRLVYFEEYPSALKRDEFKLNRFWIPKSADF